MVELRFILHDWSDEQALRISECCARDPAPARFLLDLTMMTILAGKERHRADFELLFAQAGFRLDKVVPTRALASVVVGIPVN